MARTNKRRISSTSLEYVQAEVRAVMGGHTIDPTADVVEMAFVAPGTEPAPADWKASIWETDTSGPLSMYLASCLVGPTGTVTLPGGTYAVFVRIHDVPEVPVLAAGFLEVY